MAPSTSAQNTLCGMGGSWSPFADIMSITKLPEMKELQNSDLRFLSLTADVSKNKEPDYYNLERVEPNKTAYTGLSIEIYVNSDLKSN